MKTAKDPRHLERIKIMQELFATDFQKKDRSELKSAQNVMDNLEAIDKLIHDSAPSWPIDKINKIDLAILRLAVYELIVSKNAPTKVVVDEAVELAKEYGSEASSGFINGALGKIISEEKLS